MRKTLFILLIVIAFLIESRVSVYGAQLSLTVLFPYYIGLRYGALRGMALGAALGLVADGLAGTIIGPNILSMATVGFLASFLIGGTFTWTPLLGFLSVLVLTFSDSLISFVSIIVFAYPSSGPYTAFALMLIPAVINAPAGLLLRPKDEE